MSDVAVEPLAPPTNETSDVWPIWTNLQDNWRAEDAHWLRNRSVQIFTGNTQRNGAMSPGGTPLAVFGMLSIIPVAPPGGDPDKSVTGGPDFWNGTAWESVRYPSLAVDSKTVPNQIKLTYQGASSGIILDSTGKASLTTINVGTGGNGYTGDQTGLTLKTGPTTVKLSTDANIGTVQNPNIFAGLVINQPVAISPGSLTVSGSITANALSVSTINATGTTTLQGALTAPSITATSGGPVVGGTVQGGTVILSGNQVKATGTAATAALTLPATGAVVLDGPSVTINPATTFAGVVNVNGQTNFVGRPWLAMGGTQPTWVAAVWAQANQAPNVNCPDGTIWISY